MLETQLLLNHFYPVTILPNYTDQFIQRVSRADVLFNGCFSLDRYCASHNTIKPGNCALGFYCF